MKNLLLVAVFALISASFAPVASAAPANIAENLCQYVSADDKKRLRSYLKSNKLKIRNIFSGIQCNGKDLLAFASDNNAVATGSLMISKLPKKTVANSMASITSAELVAAANKRVNG